jgi:hypothetical protein
VYRVEKSKDCNRSGEVFSNLERVSCFIASSTPVESFRIQLLTQGTSAFLSFNTLRSLPRKNSFVERTQPLRNFSKRSRAGCTKNLGLIRFL